MYEENYFVPKILLRGDKAEFFVRIGQRPFKLVGEINFVGEAEGQQFHFLRDGKFSLNGKLHGYQELVMILKGGGQIILYSTTAKNFGTLEKFCIK